MTYKKKESSAPAQPGPNPCSLELSGDKLGLQTRLEKAVMEKRRTATSLLTPYVLDHLDGMLVKISHPKVFYIECYPQQDPEAHDAAVTARGVLNPTPLRIPDQAPPIPKETPGAQPATPPLEKHSAGISLRFQEFPGRRPEETVETLANKIKLVEALR